MSITQNPENHDLDAQLAKVVDSWPELSPEVRAKIMDLVDAAKDGES